MARSQAGGYRPVPAAGLWRALGLTLASAVVWGVAHVAAGRRVAGFTLMGVLALLVGGAATAALAFQDKLKQIAVQGTWLNVITAAILALALTWASIVIRSYQVVRPPGLPTPMRVASTTLVVVMSLLICTPLVYAANTTYVLRDTLSKIFPGDDHTGQQVNAANPWKNIPGFHTNRRADATIIQVMRRAAAKAIADSTAPKKPSPTPTATVKKRKKKKTAQAGATASPSASSGANGIGFAEERLRLNLPRYPGAGPPDRPGHGGSRGRMC
jgi:hypothetical protein